MYVLLLMFFLVVSILILKNGGLFSMKFVLLCFLFLFFSSFIIFDMVGCLLGFVCVYSSLICMMCVIFFKFNGVFFCCSFVLMIFFVVLVL